VGAGCGTWEDPAYINTLFGMSGLDYIDLHIYAMNKNATLLDRALTYAQEAKAAGKRVTVSEAWLWKAAPEELGSGIASSDKIMNRDVFSFWTPLDERFFRDIVNLGGYYEHGFRLVLLDAEFIYQPGLQQYNI